MDGRRFDDMTRRLGAGASRRRVLAGIAGAALAAVGIGRGRASAAQTPWWQDYVDFSGSYCGGIAGILCPAGYICVGDPDDSCDPATGGADCAGTCQKQTDASACAAILCETGTFCCDDGCGNGSCVPIGEVCPQATCEPPADDDASACAAVLCETGTQCCDDGHGNGICVPIGEECPPATSGEPCGDNVCGDGEYCCNESCGICAPIGGVCTQEFCG